MNGQRVAPDPAYPRSVVLRSLCGLLVLLVSGCEVRSTVPDHVDEGVALIGQVLHAQTGEVMPGVRVQIAGLDAVYTDGGGFYSFRKPPTMVNPTFTTITAEAKGYAPASRSVKIGSQPTDGPTLRLTPLADAILVGPDGVSTMSSGGIRVRVPANSSRRPTWIRVTRLIDDIIHDPRYPDVIEEAAGLFVEFGDLNPGERVSFDVPLHRISQAGEQREVRRWDVLLSRWTTIASATVTSDGISAGFTVTADDGPEILWLSENRRIRFRLGLPSIEYGVEEQGSRRKLTDCEWGLKVIPAVPGERNPNLVLPALPPTMDRLRALLQERYGKTREVVRPEYRIKQGQRRTLVVWMEYDAYQYWLVAILETLNAEGKWDVDDTESGWVRFWTEWMWEEEWSCHNQGQTPPP